MRLMHILLAIFIVPVLVFFGYLLAGKIFDSEADKLMKLEAECNLTVAPCTVTDETLSLKVEFSRTPVTGEQFTVLITPDKTLGQVTIGFIQRDEKRQSSPRKATYNEGLGHWQHDLILESESPKNTNWSLLIATSGNDRQHFAEIPFRAN